MLPVLKTRHDRLRDALARAAQKVQQFPDSEVKNKKIEIEDRLILYRYPELQSDNPETVKQFLEAFGAKCKARADEAANSGNSTAARKNRYLQIECRYMLMKLEYDR